MGDEYVNVSSIKDIAATGQVSAREIAVPYLQLDSLLS